MGQIEINAICKAYRNRRKQRRKHDDPKIAYRESIPVLDNINLQIKNGEMVCILGQSGCGKSTLLRIIAGFEPASSGEVIIDGRRVHKPDSDHIFVFQHNGLLPWMTVSENVGLGLRNLKNPLDKRERMAEYIEIVELEGFEHHYPHELSGGMRRRAELARALAVNPNLLIMDEPFSGLDFLTHMKMREEVVNMHKFVGKTTLVVTHDIDDALVMGDRIVVLDGRPAQVRLNHRLDFPHPRDFRQHHELNQLRNEIFLMQGVSYAV
ncbi:MAG TPA: ABC transporter ATP-binding protein [Proteobacteria bacterium]|nr:ABC transporter ATP-binding protein [Pseudomonadota bacterium]